ncbi:hypothetical protein ACMA1D_10600 [Streptomyces sp. 796.1]|uniref:hypothetical protein n=1 Tax=Streptomyces sp. 796.1 TaxID=3163029 RepID=UPI0039C9ACAF
MFSVAFLKRLAEQALVAGLLAFGAVALGGDGPLTMAVLPAAAAAAGRAAYGVLVRNVGEPEAPSVK